MLKSEGSLEGLEEVLPIRNHRTLQRCDTWVLVFISPAYAMEFQQRVVEWQELWSRQVATVSTITSIMLPKTSSIDGQAAHPKLSNYALTSTLQNVSVAAQLSPFDSNLQRAIRIHRGLYQSESSENQFFPVRLHLDHPTLPFLDSHYIGKLLKLDGIMRGRRWDLPENDDAVIQVEPTTVPGLSQITLGGSECDSVTSISKMWRINFLTAFDATRFVRIWHRKPLPLLGNVHHDELGLYVKAECIF
ncbi:hypothetical protein BBP40_008198 [Aspergillus hancockii]|nr:hypothetical protein BBP40_008198 [Aspergillus hancockii]